jgi:hypothetical protein
MEKREGIGIGVDGLAGRLRLWNGRWAEIDGQNSVELDGCLLRLVLLKFLISKIQEKGGIFLSCRQKKKRKGETC